MSTNRVEQQQASGRAVNRRTFVAGAAAIGAASALTGSALAQDATPASDTSATPSSQAAASQIATREGAPKFGFVLSHEQFRTPDLLDFAVGAEQAGFDEIWMSDHFQPWQDNEGHAMFPWLTMALVGERTSKIVFGTGVTCPTYRHHPSQVAQVFASLGVLYPGRVFLGAGTGEALNELAATGQWAPYEERSARWVEAIELIRKLWKGDWIEHKGDYYQVPIAKLYDVPDQPVPVFMAASGPKSARLVGQHADGWITGAADLLKKPQLKEAFQEGARAAGKDPATMPVRAETFVVVGGEEEATYAAKRWNFTPKSWTKNLLWEPDPRKIERKAADEISLKEVSKDWPVSEDPAVHVEAIQKVIDAGASHVYIHSGQADQHNVIEFYGDKVLPLLRGKS